MKLGLREKLYIRRLNARDELVDDARCLEHHWRHFVRTCPPPARRDIWTALQDCDLAELLVAVQWAGLACIENPSAFRSVLGLRELVRLWGLNGDLEIIDRWDKQNSDIDSRHFYVNRTVAVLHSFIEFADREGAFQS
jgi:hypothetical protein